jgi:phosphatidate cytidylyltransferase
MKRILTAIVLIFAVLALVFFGKPWMITLFSAIVAELAIYEYLQLATTNTPDATPTARIPLWWMASATALLFLATLPNWPDGTILALLSGLTLVLFAWNGFISHHNALERVLPDTAKGIFGLLYVAYPLTLIPLLRAREDGIALVVFLMVCVWAGDIAALYIGKRYGKRKLAPSLSPNKTWEGSLASIVGSVLAAGLVMLIGDQLSAHGNTVLHITEPVWQSILLAIVLNVAAQLGDLLESAIKRGANVKDSGTMLPGHGGILDRIDALLLAAPVLWFALLLKDAFGLGRF